MHPSPILLISTDSLSVDMFKMDKHVKWLKDITLAAYADNLFLLDKYNGFDPDVSLSGQRIDQASYPKARTVTFSINVRY